MKTKNKKISDSLSNDRSKEINRIKTKAKELKADLKVDYEEQMKDLRVQQKVANEMLKTEIKDGNEICREMKADLHDSRKKLRKETTQASSIFSKKKDLNEITKTI